jgi:AcrR family transcriptional regulator
MSTRRTQQERSETTRQRILDAVMQCLREEGWVAATTPRIAEIAGISRGALLHHYPTKSLLMRAALDHVLEQGQAQFLRAIEGVPDGPERLSTMIDALWATMSSDTFVPWIEVLVASRRDPELRETVEAFALRTQAVVDENFRRLFGVSGRESDVVAQAPLFAFALVEGLALRQLVIQDNRAENALDVLKRLAGLFQLAVLPPRSS